MNLCDLPAWVIASCDFNANPIALHLAGVRRSNKHFFEKLAQQEDPKERGRIFHEYLDVKFALHQWSEYTGKARSSLRNSYVRFLHGWGVDSNSIEGAVMKSWVQSRFGVLPTYHKSILKHQDGEEDARFASDRMKGSARTNAIFSQLDLMYEFCQYELNRRWPEKSCLTLYRGTYDPEEHFVQKVEDKRQSIVRLNNLVSFTCNRENAWEFGSTVWQATVAASKIVFFSGLLPNSILNGEDEYLVIGGDYLVKELLY
ncbi:NAD(+)--dinitrogen-reductase ADP-D-ribosyltransferase [Coraliomargarita parva]|uniref:NAD(+)--dinitrogen-reductase ADP-D-ribosyltransferase n=1 Tax=Coraliomargarita parva TaxID=3014050 RepID=UPI0022B3B458|nr:NAD(+)--dinitrogen-reductase ADP-D-ribosyltransferase [Coraliomargarita parva]